MEGEFIQAKLGNLLRDIAHDYDIDLNRLKIKDVAILDPEEGQVALQIVETHALDNPERSWFACSGCHWYGRASDVADRVALHRECPECGYDLEVRGADDDR